MGECLPFSGERRRFDRSHPLKHPIGIGDATMRSNSGRDESRNNMRDPTMRDRNEQRTKASLRSRTSHAKAPADHRMARKD
jgi:hypothetical protein